jgi:hypothetical protein
MGTVRTLLENAILRADRVPDRLSQDTSVVNEEKGVVRPRVGLDPALLRVVLHDFDRPHPGLVRAAVRVQRVQVAPGRDLLGVFAEHRPQRLAGAFQPCTPRNES